jgi:hypothetical protein
MNQKKLTFPRKTRKYPNKDQTIMQMVEQCIERLLKVTHDAAKRCAEDRYPTREWLSYNNRLIFLVSFVLFVLFVDKLTFSRSHAARGNEG